MSAQAEGGPSRFEPPVGTVSGPFWEATREQRLVLQWCRACERPIFYPRAACPGCLGTDLEWRPASGRGTVHAVSVQHKPGMPMPAFTAGPYAVAIVELEEGPRLMANVANCEPESVAVGMAVEVCWEALSDGRHLPQFQPAGG